MRGPVASCRSRTEAAGRITASWSIRRSNASFVGSRSSHRGCATPPSDGGSIPWLGRRLSSPLSSTSSTATVPCSRRNRRAFGMPGSSSSPPPALSFRMRSTAWGSRLRRKCRLSRVRKGSRGIRLQAFLLFLYFSFSPRLLLLSLGPRAAATAERAPFTGLPLAAEVHREDYQDYDPVALRRFRRSDLQRAGVDSEVRMEQGIDLNVDFSRQVPGIRLAGIVAPESFIFDGQQDGVTVVPLLPREAHVHPVERVVRNPRF